jgi:hypothetical protein
LWSFAQSLQFGNPIASQFEMSNHEHAIALNFFAYNIIFKDKTLRMPPALKARVADHWWTYEELVEMIDGADRP